MLISLQNCRGLNNFATLTSIISALGAIPIARLKRTWNQVPLRTQGMLERMRRLVAGAKNFDKYREALQAANLPCISLLSTGYPRYAQDVGQRIGD